MSLEGHRWSGARIHTPKQRYQTHGLLNVLFPEKLNCSVEPSGEHLNRHCAYYNTYVVSLWIRISQKEGDAVDREDSVCRAEFRRETESGTELSGPH